MFSHYKEVGLPAGPLGEPAQVWRTGTGKYHLIRTCKPNLEPVEVVLWDLDEDAFCSKCIPDSNLPHYSWRQHLVSLFAGVQAVRSIDSNLQYDLALAGRDYYNRGGFVTWAAPIIFDLSDMGEQGRQRLPQELRDWFDQYLRPRLTDALDRIVGVLPMFGAPDWHLRYAAADPFGYDESVRILKDGSTLSGNPLRIADPVLADLRDGLLWQWFKTDGAPDRDVLALAALDYVRPSSRELMTLDSMSQLRPLQDSTPPRPVAGQTLSEYLNHLWVAEVDRELHTIAYRAADTLITSYQDALSSPNVLVQFNESATYSAHFTVRPMAGALMTTASRCYDIAESRGAMLVLPSCVVGMLAFGSTHVANGNARTDVTVYGPLMESDTSDVVNIARLLHRDDEDSYPPSKALEMARLTHHQAS
jgi:hypothetical protein